MSAADFVCPRCRSAARLRVPLLRGEHKNVKGCWCDSCDIYIAADGKRWKANRYEWENETA